MKSVLAMLMTLSLVAACGPREREVFPIGEGDPSSCAPYQVHVIGVYESYAGTMHVNVDRPGTHVLVLTSYDANAWSITANPGATIATVFAAGYHPQSISAPANTAVRAMSLEEHGEWFGCGYSLPYNGGGCDTNAMLAAISANIGPVSSFNGCYVMSALQLEADATITGDCGVDQGYQIDHAEWDVCPVTEPPADGELHVIGIYESRSDHAYGYHPEGAFSLHVQRASTRVLALSAYEPTHWTVTTDPGVQLDRIFVFGYHAQRVTAPPGMVVVISDYESGGSFTGCGYSLPYNGGGCDTNELLAGIERDTGRQVTSFNGCYTLTRASLREDMHLDSDCANGPYHALNP